MIPYGRQDIDAEDVAAVVQALQSDFLTCGPRVAAFERTLADFCGAGFGVAVSNGTAALHCAMFALGIGPGDEVIVPPITFAATANCVLYQGGTPVFADVEPSTLLLAPEAVEHLITPRTKAVIGVDYAGQPCDWTRLRSIATAHGLKLVADACHALGAEDQSRTVGQLADLTVLSFHPVKHLTTGEGGMALTDDPAIDARLRMFRNHGIATDFRQREAAGTWVYEMTELGYNYRITDIQCALGSSQLRRLPQFLARRRQCAARYDAAFAGTAVRPLALRPGALHAYHLYVVRVPERDRVLTELRNSGIGANVHYLPVYLHPYYRQRLGTGPGQCPIAEAAYGDILSLPLYPGLTDEEIDTIVRETIRAVGV
jgi:UDP-4-amino-4,6-dideoxy-N-acetyl-beta-L-altrosamine transaminase